MSDNTKKITYKQVIDFYENVRKLDSKRKDRLSVAMVDFHDVLKPHYEAFYKKEGKINKELASLDSLGNFYTDSFGQPIFTKFTKESHGKKDERLEELLKEVVSIEVYPIKDLTRVKTLHLSVIRMFNGFIFNISKEEIEELYSGKFDEEAGEKK